MNRIFLVSNYLIINQLGGAKYRWTTLEHNGVMFPPEYVKHNTPVIYQGKEIVLDKDAEEAATFYAKFIDTEYVKNKIFNKNFWNDWKNLLGPNHPIQNLEDVDFRPINDYLMKKKEEKKFKMDKLNDYKEEDEERYKFAMVDGKKQPVGNFRVEPPGIYIGRGACNPKSGKIKRRIYPEDVTINIGKEAKIPETLPGHKWGNIVHDRTVEWLASWKDDITGKTKYVWLGAQSEQRAKSDAQKFDQARKLKRKIKKIRAENEKLLRSSDPFDRQIAIALYFIDNFALRVGNEKADDESDTVGVTTLRVEHVQLLDGNGVRLDFLGKDSVPYNRTLQVDTEIYQSLKELIHGKNKNDLVFDLITPNDVNKYLQGFMKGLTAKVFRTYHASNLFQKELKKITKKYENYDEADKINLLLDEFNKANAKVARLCNHQKNITKNTNKQIENLNKMIKKSQEKLRKARKSKRTKPETIKKMQDVIKKLKAKKVLKIELKNISLGTSKINYIDPRITVAFIKKHNLPINKIFSKTLQEKFKWAMDVPEDYQFGG